MKQKINYQNLDYNVFQGFYETCIFNSDTINDYNVSNRYENPDWVDVDIEGENWEKFTNEVGKRIANEIIIPILTADKDICDKGEYKRIVSPQYYNWSNDDIEIELNIDIEKLAEKIQDDADLSKGFDDYLKANFTDRSGFISFYANNIDEYMQDVESKPLPMIDYYILTDYFSTPFVANEVFDDDWHTYYEDMLNIVDDCIGEFAKPIKEMEC